MTDDPKFEQEYNEEDERLSLSRGVGFGAAVGTLIGIAIWLIPETLLSTIHIVKLPGPLGASLTAFIGCVIGVVIGITIAGLSNSNSQD
jgi:hypothetical protein